MAKSAAAKNDLNGGLHLCMHMINFYFLKFFLDCMISFLLLLLHDSLTK